jgi:hypothetical protein
VARFQKFTGKTVDNLGEAFIILVRPEKGLLKTLVAVVGVVFCIYAIADDNI